MANITKTEDIIKICDEKQVVYENRFMKNKQTWVKYHCDKHPELLTQERSIIKLKSCSLGCKQCMKDYIKNHGKTLFIDDIVKKFEQEDLHILNVYFDEVLQRRVFTFICNKHKNYGVQIHDIRNLNKIRTPCKYCSNNFKRDMNLFKEKLSEVNGTISVSGEYINNKINVNCECMICGSKWKVTPDNLINKQTGCPVCSKSKGEFKIAKYLNNKNIDFLPQYTFHDCKNIRPLPFDFYIPSYNLLIEYQGSQHYIPTNFYDRKNIELSEQQYQKVKYNDKIKFDYCKHNKITLIAIPYWDYNNIENILDNILNRKENFIT